MDERAIARILGNMLAARAEAFIDDAHIGDFCESVNAEGFSHQLDPSFLKAFIKRMKPQTYYELIDNIGQRSFLFLHHGVAYCIGPYLSAASEEDLSHFFYANGFPKSVHSAYRALLYSRPVLNPYYIETVCNNILRGAFPDDYINFVYEKEDHRASSRSVEHKTIKTHSSEAEQSTIKRYETERLFLEKIEEGNVEGCRTAAIALFSSTDQSKSAAAYFFANPDVSSAMFRTMVRLAAARSGLSPVIIDRITSKYAQRMRGASTQREYMNHFIGFVEEMSASVSEYRTASSGGGSLTKQVVSYLLLYYYKPYSPDELAKKMNISKSHLEHIFKSETGKTIREYLEEVRVKVAKTLLTEGGISIGEVARLVGYDDANYFVKVFKRQIGMTPSTYRKKERKA